MSKANNGIAEFIYDWNLNYPIDRWYREKYNIPFGSKKHRSSSVVSMRIDFEEDLLYKRELEKALKRKEYKVGNWLNPYVEKELSEEEKIKQFDDLDLNNMILDKKEPSE